MDAPKESRRRVLSVLVVIATNGESLSVNKVVNDQMYYDTSQYSELWSHYII